MDSLSMNTPYYSFDCGGVHFIVLDASYYQVGDSFMSYDHTTYGEAVEANHPKLRHVFPYKDPVYAIVEICDREIRIKGTSSTIVGASPQSLQFHKPGLVDPVTASVCDKVLPL